VSATGRNKSGKERDPFDYYPTPRWCVDRLLEGAPWLDNHVHCLEPCAGDGAILRALPAHMRARFDANDIQRRFRRALKRLTLCQVTIMDALKLQYGFDPWGLVLTNPPFFMAFDLLKHFWDKAQEIVFLLRVSFLESELRNWWLRQHPPALLILPDRPQFVKGDSDNAAYAWMRWEPRNPLFVPTVKILESTPLEERRMVA
jgi:hypothetical protein